MIKKNIILFALFCSIFTASAQTQTRKATFEERYLIYLKNREISRINKYEKQHKGDPLLLYIRGQKKEDVGKYMDALTDYREALILERADPKSWGKYIPYPELDNDDNSSSNTSLSNLQLRRACLELSLKNYRLCIDECNLALLGNLDQDLLSYRATALSALNIRDSAYHDYKLLIKMAPNNPMYWVNFANYTRDLNKPDSANLGYKKVLEYSGNLEQYKKIKIYAAIQLGRFAEADSLCAQAILSEEDNGVYYQYKGLANVYLLKYDEAIFNYNKALETNADKADSKYSVAVIHSYQDKNQLALSEIEDIIKKYPKKSHFFLLKASLQDKLGNYEGAATSYDEAIKLDPSNGTTLISKAMLLAKYNQFQEASKALNSYKNNHFQSFLENEHYLYVADYLRACTEYLSKNDYNHALAFLKKALTGYRTPESRQSEDKLNAPKFLYEEILAKIGWVYKQQKDYPNALIYMNKAQGFNNRNERTKSLVDSLNTLLQLAIKNDKAGPVINILSPSRIKSVGDSTLFVVQNASDIYLSGEVSDLSGIASVTINDKPVENMNAEGFFYNTSPSEGKEIIIRAVDKKGNVTVSPPYHFLVASKNNKNPQRVKINIPEDRKPVFYAIIIANSNYSKNLGSLQSTISEAEEFRKILISKYGFKAKNIDTIYNQDRNKLLRALSSKLESFKKDDNVVVYYGGHGTYLTDESKNVTGFWIPVDGDKDISDKSYEERYISSNYLMDLCRNNKSSHLLIISDSCYGAAMSSRGPEDDKIPGLEYQFDSRQMLVSADWQPSGQVSEFNKAVIIALKNNQEEFFTAADLQSIIHNDVKVKGGSRSKLYNIEGDRKGEFTLINKTFKTK